MRCIGVTVVLLASLVGAPGIAADTPAASGTEFARNETAGKAATAKEKVYCISEATSGTRVAKKVCKTKTQWQVDGVEIDENVGKN